MRLLARLYPTIRPHLHWSSWNCRSVPDQCPHIHTHTRMHARTHARTHAHTHALPRTLPGRQNARTHATTYTHTHTTHPISDSSENLLTCVCFCHLPGCLAWAETITDLGLPLMHLCQRVSSATLSNK